MRDEILAIFREVADLSPRLPPVTSKSTDLIEIISLGR
jgi:hypothetical protein